MTTVETCVNGHKRTPANTRVDARGHRVCRACSRESSKKYRSKPNSKPCADCGQAPRRKSQSYCVECHNRRQREYWDRTRRDSEGNQERNRRRRGAPARAARLKREYGLTFDDYERLLKEQGGVCAICRQIPDDKMGFVVDHNHMTGEVRGITCQPCNSGLGMFRDDPERLASAIAYLTRGMT